MSDDLARRDRLVAQWALSLKERGAPVPTETLQRITANDLRLVDRAKADGRLGTRKKPKKWRQRREGVARPNLHAEAQAAAMGGSFFTREVKTLVDAPRVESVSGLDAERLVAMQRRIRLLTQRGPGRIKSNQTIEQGPWVYPKFANEIGMTCLAYNMRIGGYRDLNMRDRNRRFYRCLQDICDRSDAVIGVAWWVK